MAKDTIYVKAVEAKNLKRGDVISSDPYMKVKVKGLFHRSRKTHIEKNTRNPRWNTDFVLHANKPEDTLVVKVYDYDRFSKNDLLGRVEIPLAKYIMHPGVTYNEWFPLMQKKWGGMLKNEKGEVHLLITFNPAMSIASASK